MEFLRNFYLKYTFINNKKNSNFKKFIDYGSKLVPLLSKAKYIKSAYVVRCIDISKSNQNRKTMINIYKSFSLSTQFVQFRLTPY